jgi:hypothetical protein
MEIINGVTLQLSEFWLEINFLGILAKLAVKCTLLLVIP